MWADVVGEILARPETWGGVAAASTFGWLLAERRAALMAKTYAALMDRFATAVLSRGGES